MSLSLSHYIGQVVHLRLVINGDYPEKDAGQQYVILDAGETSLFGLRADAIEAKDFDFYILPLSGNVYHEITGVADGRGVLLRLQNHLPHILSIERIIGTTRSYQVAMLKYAVPLHRINELLARSSEPPAGDEEDDEPDTPMEPLDVSGKEQQDFSVTIPEGVKVLKIQLTVE